MTKTAALAHPDTLPRLIRFSYKNMEKVQPCNIRLELKKQIRTNSPYLKRPNVLPPSIASNYYLQKVMDITPPFFYFHFLYDVFLDIFLYYDVTMNFLCVVHFILHLFHFSSLLFKEHDFLNPKNHYNPP